MAVLLPEYLVTAEPKWDTVAGLGTMLHTTDSHVFAGSCIRGCKTDSHVH